MSKTVSYYDWELSFKKKADLAPIDSRVVKRANINSLGIPDNDFKEFMKNWKKENLTP